MISNSNRTNFIGNLIRDVPDISVWLDKGSLAGEWETAAAKEQFRVAVRSSQVRIRNRPQLKFNPRRGGAIATDAGIDTAAGSSSDGNSRGGFSRLCIYICLDTYILAHSGITRQTGDGIVRRRSYREGGSSARRWPPMSWLSIYILVSETWRTNGLEPVDGAKLYESVLPI